MKTWLRYVYSGRMKVKIREVFSDEFVTGFRFNSNQIPIRRGNKLRASLIIFKRKISFAKRKFFLTFRLGFKRPEGDPPVPNPPRILTDSPCRGYLFADQSVASQQSWRRKEKKFFRASLESEKTAKRFSTLFYFLTTMAESSFRFFFKGEF